LSAGHSPVSTEHDEDHVPGRQEDARDCTGRPWSDSNEVTVDKTGDAYREGEEEDDDHHSERKRLEDIGGQVAVHFSSCPTNDRRLPGQSWPSFASSVTPPDEYSEEDKARIIRQALANYDELKSQKGPVPIPLTEVQDTRRTVDVLQGAADKVTSAVGLWDTASVSSPGSSSSSSSSCSGRWPGVLLSAASSCGSLDWCSRERT